MLYVAKTKKLISCEITALISCEISAQLICVLVFSYSKADFLIMRLNYTPNRSCSGNDHPKGGCENRT